MTVGELILRLKQFPKDYVVEVHVGMDHWIVTEADADKPHKRTDWWKRRRKVVILK